MDLFPGEAWGQLLDSGFLRLGNPPSRGRTAVSSLVTYGRNLVRGTTDDISGPGDGKNPHFFWFLMSLMFLLWVRGKGAEICLLINGCS